MLVKTQTEPALTLSQIVITHRVAWLASHLHVSRVQQVSFAFVGTVQCRFKSILALSLAR